MNWKSPSIPVWGCLVVGILAIINEWIVRWVDSTSNSPFRLHSDFIWSVVTSVVVAICIVVAAVINRSATRSRIATPPSEEQERRRRIQQSTEWTDRMTGVVAEATLLYEYADEADYLNRVLESVWHHWDNCGFKLIRPLAQKYGDQIKNWGSDDSVPCAQDLNQFRTLYWHYRELLKSRFPNLKSELTEIGEFSDMEYLVIRRSLTSHANFLRRNAGADLASTGVKTG